LLLSGAPDRSDFEPHADVRRGGPGGVGDIQPWQTLRGAGTATTGVATIPAGAGDVARGERSEGRSFGAQQPGKPRYPRRPIRSGRSVLPAIIAALARDRR